MRQLLCYAVTAAMVILTLTAEAATATARKKTTKSTTVARRVSSSPKKGASTSTKKGAATKKGAPTKSAAKKTTWRNRQLTPSPERYKEIQQALVAKGYLRPEDAGGPWNQTSIDALKNFQASQNIDSSGKINSLSLIALGLGPRHDSPPVKPAEAPQ